MAMYSSLRVKAEGVSLPFHVPDTGYHQVPHDREPEFSKLYDPRSVSLDDHNALRGIFSVDHAALLREKQRIMISSKGFSGGTAFHSMRVHSKEADFGNWFLRHRFKLCAQTGQISHGEWSVKNLGKDSTQRIEFQSKTRTDQIGEGYDMFVEENPGLPDIFHRIDQRSFVVSSVIGVSRTAISNGHIYADSEDIATIDVTCHDACIITPPQIIQGHNGTSQLWKIGSRIETEDEIAGIVTSGADLSDEEKNDIINSNIETKKRTLGFDPNAIVFSKLESSDHVVDREIGLEEALSMNIHPRDYATQENLMHGLHMLAAALPNWQAFAPNLAGYTNSGRPISPIERMVAAPS